MLKDCPTKKEVLCKPNTVKSVRTGIYSPYQFFECIAAVVILVWLFTMISTRQNGTDGWNSFDGLPTYEVNFDLLAGCDYK